MISINHIIGVWHPRSQALFLSLLLRERKGKEPGNEDAEFGCILLYVAGLPVLILLFLFLIKVLFL
jgi:hypothetical protein